MEKCRSEAARNGFIRTLLGRIRYLPGIHSSQAYVRSEAERAAGNHPIQGTAADIVKLWMRQLWKMLTAYGVNAKLISDPVLQVHDELILEFDEGQEQLIDFMVKESLSEAVRELEFTVPIRCGGKWATTWGQLK